MSDVTPNPPSPLPSPSPPPPPPLTRPSTGSGAENAEERLVNYLLSPERYNKLIRPAVNKSQQVAISIQVSLSQLISVVRIRPRTRTSGHPRHRQLTFFFAVKRLFFSKH